MYEIICPKKRQCMKLWLTAMYNQIKQWRQRLPGGSLLGWPVIRLPVAKCWRSNSWKIPVMHPICFDNSGFSSESDCKIFAAIISLFLHYTTEIWQLCNSQLFDNLGSKLLINTNTNPSTAIQDESYWFPYEFNSESSIPKTPKTNPSKMESNAKSQIQELHILQPTSKLIKVGALLIKPRNQ